MVDFVQLQIIYKQWIIKEWDSEGVDYHISQGLSQPFSVIHRVVLISRDLANHSLGKGKTTVAGFIASTYCVLFYGGVMGKCQLSGSQSADSVSADLLRKHLG